MALPYVVLNFPLHRHTDVTQNRRNDDLILIGSFWETLYYQVTEG